MLKKNLWRKINFIHEMNIKTEAYCIYTCKFACRQWRLDRLKYSGPGMFLYQVYAVVVS